MVFWRYIVPSSIIVATVLGLYASLAQAQMGPGHPGRGGPDGFGGPFSLTAVLLQPQVHTQLGLTSAQESQWQQLQADATTVHTQIETSRQSSDAAVANELAKTTPDLVTLDALLASGHEAVDAAEQQLRTEAAALYRVLSADQQATIITSVKTAFERFASRPAALSAMVR